MYGKVYQCLLLEKFYLKRGGIAMSMIKRMVATMNRRLIREGKEPIGLYWPGKRGRIYPGATNYKRRKRRKT